MFGLVTTSCQKWPPAPRQFAPPGEKIPLRFGLLQEALLYLGVKANRPMQSFHDSLESRLEPLWLAVVGGVSALYGIWPGIAIYNDHVGKHNGGFGWFSFLIYAPIAFVITLAISSKLLVGLFFWLESQAARIAVCLFLIYIFWAKHGVPNPLCLSLIGFTTVFLYFHARKLHADARDREEFFNE